MKTQEFQRFQAEPEDDRRGVFTATAARLGITEFLAEKDFWVCRVLDILMKEPPWQPKRFFKGGTSLSKGYGTIDRFSEDIDVVFNRHTLKCEDGIAFKGDLDPTNPEAKFQSNAQRQRRFDALQAACARHMQDDLALKLRRLLPECRVVFSERNVQTIFVRYPSFFSDAEWENDDEDADYFLPRVKIEGGARSALSPARIRTITPYIQDELGDNLNLAIASVTLIAPERTFLEKVSIIHGLNCGYRDQGRLPEDRDRISRHFYDVARLVNAPLSRRAMKNAELLEDVKQHNILAFPSRWRRQDEFTRGQIQVIPSGAVSDVIRRDYVRMQDMMFGEIPEFDWIVEQLAMIDNGLNGELPL